MKGDEDTAERKADVLNTIIQGEKTAIMRIIAAKDYNEMSRRAADFIAAQVILKPDCVLGLATGSSPIGTYESLVERYEKGDLDFSHVTTVNLDEYCGLDIESNQSYIWFMHHHLFDHINVKAESIHLPDGKADEEAACRGYDQILAKVGRTDLQLLGLGLDGHIGFNEPGDAFSTRTHKVALTESTIEANKRFFISKDQVPRYAYTMGMKDIMTARRVLMIVNGKGKARILRQAILGPVTPKLPASILQLHPDCVVIADQEALSEM